MPISTGADRGFLDIKMADKSLARKLYTPAEAAVYIGVLPGTLAVWRSTGRYNLPFVKAGRLVRYSAAALDAWLATRTRDTGATA